jgi:hypothetical protein
MRFSMLIWVSASASPSKLLPTSALQPMSETRLGTNDCESKEWFVRFGCMAERFAERKGRLDVQQGELRERRDAAGKVAGELIVAERAVQPNKVERRKTGSTSLQLRHDRRQTFTSIMYVCTGGGGAHKCIRSLSLEMAMGTDEVRRLFASDL